MKRNGFPYGAVTAAGFGLAALSVAPVSGAVGTKNAVPISRPANAAPAARHKPARPARTNQPPHVSNVLTVSGAVAKPRKSSNAQLMTEFAGQVKEIDYTLKGEPHHAHVLPLLALLDAAQPRYNAQIKHHALAFLVALRSGDGYTVTLSMGELLPDYGNREAWLALDQDGKPLPDSEAPARLILPGDAKPSRWIQGVATITVLDGLKLLKTKGKPVKEQ